VHVPIGKASFPAEALVANLKAVAEELIRAKPSSAKGRYMRKAVLSSTMGPGVPLDVARLES
jgi:large subunit ribosomal protein L1